MTDLQISLRAIEAMLANDEASSNEQLQAHIEAQCPEVPPATVALLIAQERPKFFTRGLHYIEWPTYGYDYPEGEKPQAFKDFVAMLNQGR